jgi:hypothetical protein
LPPKDQEDPEASSDQEPEDVFENKIQKPFSDKEFSKAMSKIKDRVHGTQPPKRPSSAYILYQKEVSKFAEFTLLLLRNAPKS